MSNDALRMLDGICDAKNSSTRYLVNERKLKISRCTKRERIENMIENIELGNSMVVTGSNESFSSVNVFNILEK